MSNSPIQQDLSAQHSDDIEDPFEGLDTPTARDPLTGSVPETPTRRRLQENRRRRTSNRTAPYPDPATITPSRRTWTGLVPVDAPRGAAHQGAPTAGARGFLGHAVEAGRAREETSENPNEHAQIEAIVMQHGKLLFFRNGGNFGEPEQRRRCRRDHRTARKAPILLQYDNRARRHPRDHLQARLL